jgi:hypothetical protein
MTALSWLTGRVLVGAAVVLMGVVAAVATVLGWYP